ncbi:MAG: hypothetical protein OK456_01510 [Thaumarchaeota archaeon]|nr:hypothetical protein [Nitrososphaerota archaeon]
MKALKPLLFLLLFFNVTCLAPVIVTGLRIADLWYTPMATTGQASFLTPFLEFVLVCVAVEIVAVALLWRVDWARFIPLGGDIGIRSIIRGVLADRVGRAVILAFVPLYVLSFLLSSGLLLVPDVNISSYFVPVTEISYQAVGVPMIGPLAINLDLMLVGLLDLVLLSLALVLGYYVVTLVYTSQSGTGLGVPGSTQLMATQTAGAFLATSAPALATSAAICCLTPTGVNSLLYLVSASTSVLSKKVVFGYGTIAGVFWVTGLLQGLELFSTVVLGVALLGLSYYQVRRLTRQVAQRRVLTLGS